MAALPPLSQVAGAQAPTYEAYFKQADVTGNGVIGAIDAAGFLKRSALKQHTLSKIWDLSDPTGRGYLDRAGFYVALKLIALAQSGAEVNMANIGAPCAAPKMGDVGSPAMTPLGSRSGSISGLPSLVKQRSMSGSGPASGISAAERVKYDQIFDSLQPTDSLLPGDKVKPVLLNSKLPVEVLGRVWDLSDIDKDGCLDRDEFAIAMHLIYRALDNEPVPASLHPSLIPAGKRSRSGSLTAGQSAAPPAPGQQRVLGASLAGAVSVLPTGVPLPGAVQNDANKGWIVSPAEKVQFDAMFKVADLDMDGLVSGLEIRDIFIQSGLPQPTLAHIWNLCDMNGQGKLTCDQFALAMCLIQQQLKGAELPQRLPPEYIPPMMRRDSTTDGNLSSSSSSVSEPTTALTGSKELDSLTKEIEDLKLEKMQLERDKVQREADLKIRGGEVQILQKELDSVTATVNKLETQKGEAQKRLDDLDDKRSQLEISITDMKDKYSETDKQVNSLRAQITSQATKIRNQEQDLSRMRADLEALRAEETKLEQEVQATNSSMENIDKSQKNVLQELTKAKESLKLLNEELETLKSDSSLDGAVNGTSSSPTVTIGSEYSAFSSDIQRHSSIVSDMTFGSESQFASTANGGDSFAGAQNGAVLANGGLFGPGDGGDDLFGSGAVDPFGSAAVDPFSATTTHDDPFRGEDPFGGELNFGSAEASSPTGPADPFEEAFNAKAPSREIDPFQDAFESAKKVKVNTLLSIHDDDDDHDPFGDKKAPTRSTSGQMKSDPFGADPFGTDPFIPGKAGARLKNGAAPALPPKSKKHAPPRPAPPRPSPGPSASPDSLRASPAPRAKSPAPPRPPKSPLMNRAASPAPNSRSSPAGGKPPGRPKSPSPALYLNKTQNTQDNAFGAFPDDPYGAQDPFGDNADPFSKSSAPSADDGFSDFADFGNFSKT